MKEPSFGSTSYSQPQSRMSASKWLDDYVLLGYMDMIGPQLTSSAYEMTVPTGGNRLVLFLPCPFYLVMLRTGEWAFEFIVAFGSHSLPISLPFTPIQLVCVPLWTLRPHNQTWRAFTYTVHEVRDMHKALFSTHTNGSNTSKSIPYLIHALEDICLCTEQGWEISCPSLLVEGMCHIGNQIRPGSF